MCVLNNVSKVFFSWAACGVVDYVSTRAWLNQYCPLQVHFWIEREFQINQTILIEQFYRHFHVTWTHSWGSRFHWQSRYFFKALSNKSYKSFNDVIKHYVTTCYATQYLLIIHTIICFIFLALCIFINVIWYNIKVG